MNQPETKQFIESHGVVVLKADMTHDAPEAEALLESLGNKGGAIPFYAIFPAGRPNEPILLDGVFQSPEPILKALQKAGPSKGFDQVSQRDSSTDPATVIGTR